MGHLLFDSVGLHIHSATIDGKRPRQARRQDDFGRARKRKLKRRNGQGHNHLHRFTRAGIYFIPKRAAYQPRRRLCTRRRNGGHPILDPTTTTRTIRRVAKGNEVSERLEYLENGRW